MKSKSKLRIETILSVLAILGAYHFFSSIIVFWARWDDIRGSYMDASNFSATTGKILESTSRRERSGRSGRSTVFRIKYTYVAEGKTFYSDKVHFSYRGKMDPDYAEGYVNRYPVGSSTAVYFEKSNPGFSVLEPEEKENWLPYFILSGVSFFFFLAGSFFFLHRLRGHA